MQLSAPPAIYDPFNEGHMRATLMREDSRNRKKDEDVDMGASKLILISPNGTRYAVMVSNAGALSTVALP
jgi:hypothetical protein